MALDNPKYERMFSETGSDDDKISSDERGIVQDLFDQNDYIKDKHKLESQGHLIYMLDRVTQELDYLRTKIAANESCCAANTGKTTITTAQAREITANTAKVSLTSLMSGVGTTLSFGNMITTPPPKGGKTPTYSIVMTVTEGVGAKAVTKSVTLTLT